MSMCAGEQGTYRCPSRNLCRRYQEYMATPPQERRNRQVVQLYRHPNVDHCDHFIKKHTL
jgi:hypothetical protein